MAGDARRVVVVEDSTHLKEVVLANVRSCENPIRETASIDTISIRDATQMNSNCGEQCALSLSLSLSLSLCLVALSFGANLSLMLLLLLPASGGLVILGLSSSISRRALCDPRKLHDRSGHAMRALETCGRYSGVPGGGRGGRLHAGPPLGIYVLLAAQRRFPAQRGKSGHHGYGEGGALSLLRPCLVISQWQQEVVGKTPDCSPLCIHARARKSD